MAATATPLVGREAELRLLVRILAETHAGRARAVGIVGQPGIGKSRLLGELKRREADGGVLVVEGRASELERDVPFALWVDALDDVVAATPEALADVEGEHLAELAVALPAVARVAGVAPAVTGERHRTARALRTLLEHLAVRCPVAVLLDDVHWADPASAEVVSLLLHRLPRGPVLLTLTARTGRARARGLAVRRRTAARGRGDRARRPLPRGGRRPPGAVGQHTGAGRAFP